MRTPPTWRPRNFWPTETMFPAATPAAVSDVKDVREHLSSLRGLHILSMLMNQHGDEDEIVHLSTTALPALARARCEGIRLDGVWHEQCAPDQDVRETVEAQLAGQGNVVVLLDVPG